MGKTKSDRNLIQRGMVGSVGGLGKAVENSSSFMEIDGEKQRRRWEK